MDSDLRKTKYTGDYNNFVFNFIKDNSICLDVGPGDGKLGEALLQKKKCFMDCVEQNENNNKELSKKGFRNIFNLDLNFLSKNIEIEKKKYDYIIFADVLEHTVDPKTVLILFKDFLKDNGKIIISVPNVAFIQIRINLLFGKWNYTKFGIMDETHLKFFTIKTIKELVSSAELKCDKVIPYNQFKSLKFLKPFQFFFPSLFSYQIFISSSKNDH